MANPFDRFQKIRKNFMNDRKTKIDREPFPDEPYDEPEDFPHPPFRGYAPHMGFEDLYDRSKPLFNPDGTPYARAATLDIACAEDIQKLIDLIASSSIGMDKEEKDQAVNILSQLVEPLESRFSGKYEDAPFENPFTPYEDPDDQESDPEFEPEYEPEFDPETWPRYGKEETDHQRNPDEWDINSKDTIRLFPVWLLEVFVFFEKFVRNKQGEGVWLSLEILSKTASDEDFVNHEIERMSHMNAIRELDRLFEMQAALQGLHRRHIELSAEHEEAERHYKAREASAADKAVLQTIHRMCMDISRLIDDNSEKSALLKARVASAQTQYFKDCIELLFKESENSENAEKARAIFAAEAKKRTIAGLPPQFGE